MASAERRRLEPPSALLPSARPVQPVAQDLPEDLLWLRTQSGFVVDENGQALRLQGVTLRGFDVVAPANDQSVTTALGLDDDNLSTLTGLWAANLIRIPFQAKTILVGNDAISGPDLLAGLDDAIAAVTSAGMYVLLAMEAANSAASPSAPDENDQESWRSLAIRYREEPGVLFELFSSSLSLGDRWPETAQTLIGAIRREHPASLIFMSNGSGAVEIRGLPLRYLTGDPIPNIVYTVPFEAGRMPSVRDNGLHTFAESNALFVSEWIGGGSEFDRSDETALALLAATGIGWAAANWNDSPRLVVDAARHQFNPTRWGRTVQRALALPRKPQLARFSASGA